MNENDLELLKKIIDDVDSGSWGGDSWENIFPQERDAIASAIASAGYRRDSACRGCAEGGDVGDFCTACGNPRKTKPGESA